MRRLDSVTERGHNPGKMNETHGRLIAPDGHLLGADSVTHAVEGKRAIVSPQADDDYFEETKNLARPGRLTCKTHLRRKLGAAY